MGFSAQNNGCKIIYNWKRNDIFCFILYLPFQLMLFYIPIPFIVISTALWQSRDYPSAMEVAMKKMGKTVMYKTLKDVNLCMVLGSSVTIFAIILLFVSLLYHRYGWMLCLWFLGNVIYATNEWHLQKGPYFMFTVFPVFWDCVCYACDLFDDFHG